MIATSRFLPNAISPFSVQGPSAMTWPASTRSPASTIGDWLAQVPWLERANLRILVGTGAVVGAGELAHPVGVPGAVVGHHGDVVGGYLLDHPGLLGSHHVAGVDRR